MLTRSLRPTLLLLLVFTSILLCAQGNNQQGRPNPQGNGQAYGVITGIVYDDATNQPVEYANIVLFSQRDSSMSTGTITDNRGRFKLTDVKQGRYYLRIQFIGYENKDIAGIQISPASADVKIGEIRIQPKRSSIQGVEITSERSMITNNLDKKVITVDRSMALGGGTATDVMENIPSINVDAEGNISLRGNANITLLIDGKPASQAGIAASDMLNQIPASAIESIEVITNPSVRYDPDGTTGIINIVLKKKTLQGFNGLVSLNAGTGDKYNGSLVLNYRHDKFNAFLNFDARKHNMTRSGNSLRESMYGENLNVLKQNDEGKMNRDNIRISGGFDYFIDTRNNVTLSVARREMEFGRNGDLVTQSFLNDSLVRYFNRNNESDRNWNGNEYTLSFKHIFPQKGREFTNDIIYNDNNMTSNSFITQQDYNVITSLPQGMSSRQWNINNNNNDVITIQGNYVYPMVSGSRIEAGYKGDIREIRMITDYKNYFPSNDEWVSQESLKDQYDYDEQIYAVYGIYASSFKKFKYQGGLRLEQVFTNSKIQQADTAFSTKYTSLYPSFHTQYDLGKKKELQLSYSRRVRRPSPREMNPYIDYSDSLNLRTGNPNLRPEFTNSIEFGILQYWKSSSLTTSLFFRNTNDEVTNISSLMDNGVTITRPLNINKETNYGVEIVGTANPYKWFKANGNLSFYRAVMSAIPEYNLEGSDRFTWSARLNMTFNVWKDGSLQLINSYMSARRSVQEYSEPRYFADASFRQDFMKKKLSMSLRLTDIFNTRKYDETIYGDNFTIVSKSRHESRVLYLGIQYQINNFNRKGNRDQGNNEESEMDF